MDIQLPPVNDKRINASLALPQSGKGPGVLVLHAWWGLKPFFKTICSRLAEKGYVALAPDLNDGEIAQTVDEAKARMERSDQSAPGDVVMAAKDYLLAHPACSSPKIGVIGFSMGAAWSLVAAERAPQQVAAAVLYYGIYEVDFSKFQAKVLGHFSDKDEWEPIEGVRSVEKSMVAAGLEATFHVYPGVSHWFVEEDRPEYNPQAAALSWSRTLEFLNTTSKPI